MCLLLMSGLKVLLQIENFQRNVRKRPMHHTAHQKSMPIDLPFSKYMIKKIGYNFLVELYKLVMTKFLLIWSSAG